MCSSAVLQPIPALIILALPLAPIDHLFTRQVADSLEEAAFLELSCYAFIHAVLDGVDALVAGDFGLVEFACGATC